MGGLTAADTFATSRVAAAAVVAEAAVVAAVVLAVAFVVASLSAEVFSVVFGADFDWGTTLTFFWSKFKVAGRFEPLPFGLTDDVATTAAP